MTLTETLSFGPLLKQMRKRAGMTQRDLASALDYSDSLISSLEKSQGLPNLEAVITRFIPALGLQDDPAGAALLIEAAAAARGERLPASITFQRTQQFVIEDTLEEHKDALPLPPTALLGRDEEVHRLCNRMLGHGGRLLTLLGPPGIGKTRLALALAAQLQVHYRQGAVFVPLAAVGDTVTLAAAILVACGAGAESHKPPRNQLIELLRRQSLLLVLDNFEQLLVPALEGEAVALVADVLAQCPGVVVLTTSRERLHLRAEQRYQVPPLPLVAAAALFTARATAVNPSFAVTDADHPTLAAICRRLDCLPLAIELCAAQSDLFSPAQLLAQLHTRPLNLLVEGAHDLPPRQRTLRTAIEHSYWLLSDAQRMHFRRLGVFAGGFDLEAAELVANADVSALRALVGKSLVHVETRGTGTQRFLLLETLREFALEQLHACGEAELAGGRHFMAYLLLFRQADSHLRRADAAAWLARLDPEVDNLRAAVGWAFEQAQYEDLAWLLLATAWFSLMRGLSYELYEWSQRLLVHRQMLPLDLRVAILIEQYVNSRASDELAQRERVAGEIRELMAAGANRLHHATYWHFAAAHSADFAEAAAAWERSIAYAHEAQDLPKLGPEYCIVGEINYLLASALSAYGHRLIEHGRFGPAAPLLKEALALYDDMGAPYDRAEIIGVLGHLALLQGDLSQAYAHLHYAFTIAVEFNYRSWLSFWQPLLAIVLLYRGEIAQSRQMLEESLRLCSELRERTNLSRVCGFLAEVTLSEGQLVQAEGWLTQCLAQQNSLLKQNVDGMTQLLVAARLAAAQQHYRRAATLFGLVAQAHGAIYAAIAGPIRTLAEDALSVVQPALGPEEFAKAYGAGQQLSLSEAFATILTSSYLLSSTQM